MAASLFESQLYSGLFTTGDVGRLFSDSAEIRAMLLVEGALAKAQGALGVIPQDSAAAIQRAVMEVAIDPGALRAETGQNGVPVPALVAALRNEMNAPEHAQYVHWGATSQDIMDTGLMLRLRQALSLIESKLQDTLKNLAKLAEAHSELPMAGRSFGIYATPTSFGAVVATWGGPLLDLLDQLPHLRETSLLVSLSGAIGTGSALGEKAAETRAELAAGLALGNPNRSWHTDRGPLLRLVNWMHQVTLALSKMGQDCQAMAQTGINTLDFSSGGASSTLPHKQNPVAAAKLTALAHFSTGLCATLQTSAIHQYQRDASAWFGEWLSLPQIVMTAATSSETAAALSGEISPNCKRMQAELPQNLGLIYAEALTFALCKTLNRPEAQSVVKTLCKTALQQGTPLAELAAHQFPDVDLEHVFNPSLQLGQAPAEARQFAECIKKFTQAP